MPSNDRCLVAKSQFAAAVTLDDFFRPAAEEKRLIAPWYACGG
jgi:hypothetical protein